MKMPLYIKIDFREDGHLGAWWSRNEPTLWKTAAMSTNQDETSIRGVLISLADELDPDVPPVEESESVNV